MENICLLKHTGCPSFVAVYTFISLYAFICFKISSRTSVNLVRSCSCFGEQTSSAAGWGTSGPVQLLPRFHRLYATSPSMFYQLFSFSLGFDWYIVWKVTKSTVHFSQSATYTLFTWNFVSIKKIKIHILKRFRILKNLAPIEAPENEPFLF